MDKGIFKEARQFSQMAAIMYLSAFTASQHIFEMTAIVWLFPILVLCTLFGRLYFDAKTKDKFWKIIFPSKILMFDIILYLSIGCYLLLTAFLYVEFAVINNFFWEVSSFFNMNQYACNWIDDVDTIAGLGCGFYNTSHILLLIPQVFAIAYIVKNRKSFFKTWMYYSSDSHSKFRALFRLFYAVVILFIFYWLFVLSISDFGWVKDMYERKDMVSIVFLFSLGNTIYYLLARMVLFGILWIAYTKADDAI